MVQESFRAQRLRTGRIASLDEAKFDPWLGKQLCKPAWHLDFDADPSAWRARIRGPAFIDARVAINDTDRVAAMTAAGFRLIDTSLTLDRTPSAVFDADSSRTRLARKTDAEAVAAIARDNFSTDRFHRDPNISDDIADQIKSDWARNFFSGERGDWMVVGETGNAAHDIGGFLQVLHQDERLVIDLIAVDATARHKGLATAMIARAATTLIPAAPMRVGTQLANTASIRLYETLGFRAMHAEHVLHCHVD